MKTGAIAVLLLAGTAAAGADYSNRVIGNWLTSGTFDRFGDGGSFIAATGASEMLLAVRCLQKNLSLAVSKVGGDPNPFMLGKAYRFVFKVDKRPAVEAFGKAIDPRVIDLGDEFELVQSIRDSREIAMRMEDIRGTTVTLVFQTSGARLAFADLLKECPFPTN